jgi:hypothetical protein
MPMLLPAVFDEDLLAPHGRKPVGDRARDDIRRASGGDRHDDAHRLGWVGRLRVPRAKQKTRDKGLGGGERNQAATGEHVGDLRFLDMPILSAVRGDLYSQVARQISARGDGSSEAEGYNGRILYASA